MLCSAVLLSVMVRHAPLVQQVWPPLVHIVRLVLCMSSDLVPARHLSSHGCPCLLAVTLPCLQATSVSTLQQTLQTLSSLEAGAWRSSPADTPC